MGYSKTSRFYEIPYMVNGDVMDEADEQIRTEIIDNQLFAAMSTMPAGVMQEGAYQQYDAGGGNYGVVIRSAGSPSIWGTVNYRLIYDNSTITFVPMQAGTSANYYYLYLLAQPNLEFDTTAYTPTIVPGVPGVLPVDINNHNYLLLATLDLRAGYPGVLNTDPTSKVYVTTWIDHVNTRVNPHSTSLTQDELIITKHLSVSNDTAQSLDLLQTNISSTAPLLNMSNLGTGPTFRTSGEMVFDDVRAVVRLSEAGQASFLTTSQSIVGSVNEHIGGIGIQVHGLGAVSILNEIPTVQETITQSSHGFSIGNVIRNNGTIYVTAQANDDATVNTLGVVSAVPNLNSFTVVYSGRVNGLSGLTAGLSYYLSDVTPGLLTSTEPRFIKKVILEATSTTSGVVFQERLNEGASLSKLMPAYEFLNQGDFVNVLNDSGFAKVRKTRVNITGGDADGFVLENASIGNNVRVFFAGINSFMTGLTPGSVYYLDPSNPGGVISTSPSLTGQVVQRIGRSLSTTELAFNPNEPVLNT